MEPPDLQPLELPTRDEDWLGWVTERARHGLSTPAPRWRRSRTHRAGDEAILQLWNDASIALGDVFAVSSLMSVVHPDAAVMEAAEGFQIEARRFTTDLHLDADVFAQLSSLEDVPLEAGARRVLDDALRDFRRSGVDRDEETRERVRELSRRESELSQTFSRNIRDGRRTTSVPEAALDGLPEDYVAEHPAVDGMVEISTEYPDTLPFLTHARDPEQRRRVAHAFHNIGWPENDAVLAELLEVREEKATLLGYDDWPSYDAEVKMIGEGRRIPEFIDELAGAAEEAGRREIEQLREQARAEGEDVVDFSNWRHHAEAVKRERFGVDTQEVRRYFDAAKVRQGLLDVTGRLFGLDYEPVDAPTWHPEVSSYDVRLAENRQLLGRIHLDLHPRPRKYNHAAQFTLVQGVLGRQLPEGVLVCNFSRGLMELDHVVTLFHEFGHLMHHVLAGPARVGALLRRRHRVGLRRGAVADARGVGLGPGRAAQLRHRRAGRADPGGPRAADAGRRRVRQGLPDAHPDGVRRDLVLVPPGPAGRPDRPARSSCSSSTASSSWCRTRTSTPASATSTTTARRTTPTRGRW